MNITSRSDEIQNIVQRMHRATDGLEASGSRVGLDHCSQRPDPAQPEAPAPKSALSMLQGFKSKRVS
jgi:hypothetical protein